MSKTLAQCHLEIVNELTSRGEEIYNPCKKSMDRTKVYVKGREFRTKDFLCGTAIREKDGTISILPEPMADLCGIGGFKIEDLGLCDSVCYYANNDAKRYPLKEDIDLDLSEMANARINPKVELTPERRAALETMVKLLWRYGDAEEVGKVFLDMLEEGK